MVRLTEHAPAPMKSARDAWWRKIEQRKAGHYSRKRSRVFFHGATCGPDRTHRLDHAQSRKPVAHVAGQIGIGFDGDQTVE